MGKLISLAEYAKLHGVAMNTIRQKCAMGTLPGAVKIGRNWCVPDDAPYEDHRIKSGKYIGSRHYQKYIKPKRDNEE